MSGPVTLLAVNAFGDLFLQRTDGTVYRLDISGGEIAKIAGSEDEFRSQAAGADHQKVWFLLDEEKNAALRGYVPNKGECVGAKVPWVFKESASVPNNMCVMELYEYVSFMGDVFHQMQDVPDGGKVRLRIEPRSRS